MSDIEIVDSIINYKDMYRIQLDRQKLRIGNKVNDIFYLVEHFPVYTLGRRGGLDNIIKDSDIEIIKTKRGGDITFHGPGQIIIYPVINIKRVKIGIKEYIYRLEQLVINLFNSFGIVVTREKINHGVWYSGKKIASVGVRVNNGVTLHGIAVNIDNDLSPFANINPCGLKGVKVTSLKEILNRDIDLLEVKRLLMLDIREVFRECFYE